MEYRKRPVTILAVQFFAGQPLPEPFTTVVEHRSADDKHVIQTDGHGPVVISDGDYIIRGVNGEFYPCVADVFEKTYDPANTPSELDTVTAENEALRASMCALSAKIDSLTAQPHTDRGRTLELFVRQLSPFYGPGAVNARVHVPRVGPPTITLRSYDQTQEFEGVVDGNVVTPR